MSRIGYILRTTPPEILTKRTTLENEYYCDRIVEDELDSYDVTRPCLQELLHSVSSYDEIYVYKLSDLVRNASQFSILMNLCYCSGVRVVALKDCFDSEDVIFAPKSTIDFVEMLTSLRTNFKKDVKARPSNRQSFSSPLKTKSKTRLDIEKQVLFLYQTGISMPDILKACDLPQRASVYRILNKYGIERNTSLKKNNKSSRR